MTIVIFMLLCSVTIYYAHYLKRQQIINQRLADHYLAESLVELSDGHNRCFNSGSTKRLSQNKWLVTLASGKKVEVHNA